MSDIRCIIIEDEPLAAKVLADYIKELPFLKLQESFKDALAAIEWLRQNEVDLIFLDIHLPKLKGMDFLKTLKDPPAVIITTAYHQYAVEGFELNVTDYLLKPIEFARFLVAVNKVKASRPVSDPGSEHLFITVHKKKVRIPLSEILFIESQREYVKLVTTGKEYLTKMTTNEVEALLPAHLFKRVHRSFIVALNKIDSYSFDELEIKGFFVPIGRAYRDQLDLH